MGNLKFLISKENFQNLLDIHNREHNSKRYWAGQRYEQKFEAAGIRQKLTSSLKENLGHGTKEEYNAPISFQFNIFFFTL